MVDADEILPLVCVVTAGGEPAECRLLLEALAALPLTPAARAALGPLATLAGAPIPAPAPDPAPLAGSLDRRAAEFAATLAALLSTQVDPNPNPETVARARLTAGALLTQAWHTRAPSWRARAGLDLPATPPALAARVLTAAAVALAARAPEAGIEDADADAAGDCLLDLATALPAPLPLDVAALLGIDTEVPRIAHRALTWTAARAGAAALLAALTVEVLLTRGPARRHRLAWLRDCASALDTPPPYARSAPPVLMPIEDVFSPAPAPAPAAGGDTEAAGRPGREGQAREPGRSRPQEGAPGAMGPSPTQTDRPRAGRWGGIGRKVLNRISRQIDAFKYSTSVLKGGSVVGGTWPGGDARATEVDDIWVGTPAPTAPDPGLDAGAAAEADLDAAAPAVPPNPADFDALARDLGTLTAPPDPGTARSATPLDPQGPEPPPPAPIERFPAISASDLHPVAGQLVTFEVGLAALAVPGVAGLVRLPGGEPDRVWTLQVHLLFGTASAWDELQFSESQGTLVPASIDLPAPAVSGPNTLSTVRANFYLNRRWCGEGLCNLDLRRDAATAPLAGIPTPALPDWHAGLALAPEATPPDLIVRIQKAGSGDYHWSCASPHLALTAPATPADCRMTLGADAETFVRNLFKPLADKRLDAMDLADVEGAGDLIYNATPEVFKRAYWALRLAERAGAFTFDSIQIVTDEPFVPWELMRVADDRLAPDEPPEVLAIRHSVGRWLAGQSNGLTQQIPVRSLAVAASDYQQVPSVAQKLQWADTERRFLIETFGALEVPLQSGPLLAFLTGGTVQAVHFACHGKMSISAPDTSFLVLEDTPHVLKPPAIGRTEVRRGLGRQRPLVFLNACEVGGAGASLDLVAGFPAAFLSAGAAAVVCPLWAVNDERAAQIARTFYEAVMAAEGRPLGQVLREVRAAWRSEGHLTYLAYVLYGDPLARVRYDGRPGTDPPH